MSCREGWYEKKYSKCSDSKRHSKCWDDHDDDCWKEFKKCKKDQNEKCDCCCTTGLVKRLRALIGTGVVVTITTKSGAIVTGTVAAVSCDTVDVVAAATTTRTTVSVCEIESFSRPSAI
ncbi:hypothetical protein H9I32_14085 [Bacillus sp. Xin]|nr:hypothetical protein [Bacillus sp. Xin]NSW35545.1 hypothetical protein [Bacillus sp. Xin1]